MFSLRKTEPLYRTIDNIRNWMIILLFAFVIFTGALEIFLRYTPSLRSLGWTDEILRYLNIWIVFLGSSVAVKEGSHFEVTFLLQKLSPKRFLLTQKIILIINIFFLMFTAVVSIQKVISSSNVVIQAAPISIALFYLAIPVGCILMIIDYLLILLCGKHPFFSSQQERGE